MATYNIPLERFGEFFRTTEKNRMQAVADAIYEAALAGLGIVVTAAPHDTGHLQQSGHIDPDLAERAVSIVLDAPYAAISDLGSRPHWAPLTPLLDWVHRHAGTLGAGDEAAEERIARAIQEKIAMEGTKPTFFVRDSIPKLQAILARIVSARMARI